MPTALIVPGAQSTVGVKKFFTPTADTVETGDTVGTIETGGDETIGQDRFGCGKGLPSSGIGSIPVDRVRLSVRNASMSRRTDNGFPISL
jgi:hypothetical protein